MKFKSRNYIKYSSNNPIQNYLIRRFLKKILSEIKFLRPKIVLDAGCGEAFVLKSLLDSGRNLESLTGIDISKKAINMAKKMVPQARFGVMDIRNIESDDNHFDLVLCLETIEHIKNPEKALREIVRVSNKYILLSVPWEPFFSLANLLRLKNISLFGKDPEHVNFWSVRAFKKFIEANGLKVEKHEIIFPWQMILIKK